MQLGELQFGEMPHFFNTPHAFKKIGEMQSGEMQFGEMPHTLFLECGILLYTQPSYFMAKFQYINVFTEFLSVLVIFSSFPFISEQ